MKKEKKVVSSIDGFVPRRPGDQLGGLHNIDDKKKKQQVTTLSKSNNKLLHTTGSEAIRDLGQNDPGRGLGRTDISESLNDIDNFFGDLDKKQSRKERKSLKKQNQHQKSLIRRILKWVIIAIIVGVLAVGGYLGYKFIVAGGNIFQGNIFGLLNSQPLKQDANGRSNFLILGTSEDDAGHEGATLTDSMMVVSVNQTKKDMFMFSIPRDLYVQFGKACPAGYSGKINGYYDCVDDGTDKKSEQARLAGVQKFVGDIFGLDIQYGLHVNHTVIKQAVDAVGGVDVNVQGSNGAPGVFDRSLDWHCGYKCYLVKYDNGVHHLDGAHALYLSMARGDTAPTYGLSRSNFDRELNQQKILMAIKEKAMTTGILTNVGAVTQLIDALGNNLRTNVKTEEICTIMQLASGIKSSNMHSISLIDDKNSLVKTGMYGDASVVMPSEGIFQYDDLRSYIHNNLTNYAVFKEAAPVVVLNGSGQTGAGQTEADKLTDDGFNVVLVGNAPDGDYLDKVVIYQIGSGNKTTAKKLSSIYDNVIIKKTPPPLTVNGDVRFVIIVGQASI